VRVEERPVSFASKERRDPLLSIGVFSRRSRLSSKALRLYDRLEILIPAEIDEENGYRRYRESQLATARLILMLRRLEMPLARVAELVKAVGPEVAEIMAVRPYDVLLSELDEPEAASGQRGAAILAEYWQGVERRVASQRELASHLRLRLLGREGSYDMFEVLERDIPEQLVLTEQRHAVADELPKWLPDAIGRLIGTSQKFGGMVGPVSVLYHGEVNQESDGPVEVCVPIALDKESTVDVAARREPAHREAYVRIKKSLVAYPQILSAFDAVSQWMIANGKPMNGSPREVYFADFAAAGPDDEVCDVAFPI
jgi:DNA-binding transcriptional MerR regulator